MRHIGIGLVGGGYMGKAHAVALTSVGAVFDTALRPRLEVVAAGSLASAEGYARAYGVTRAAKDYLQLPMETSVKRMRDYLTFLFEGAEASKWLVPSADPMMNGKAWAYQVQPNELRPYDSMDVSYWLRYDGTNRQTFVTQTLTR